MKKKPEKSRSWIQNSSGFVFSFPRKKFTARKHQLRQVELKAFHSETEKDFISSESLKVFVPVDKLCPWRTSRSERVEIKHTV